jgi:hypothetical protein
MMNRGASMRDDPAQPRKEIIPGNEDVSPVPIHRNIVRKSALLNVVIVLTSFPALVYAGGIKAVVPALEIMAGISVVIWTATFAMSSLVTFPRIFRAPQSSKKRSDAPHEADETAVDDRWLDGPA